MPSIRDDSLEKILGEIPHTGNRRDVAGFLKEKEANGAKASTLVMHAGHLRAWGQHLAQKPFTSATKEDVTAFITQKTTQRRYQGGGAKKAKVKTVALKPSTLNVRKVILRAFQRWVRGGDKQAPFPPEVSWLEPARNPTGDRVNEDSLLTRDDLLKLLGATTSVQHKALVATLYDSGMRASEFLSLNVRNVLLDEHGAVLVLPKAGENLKTGSRRVRCLQCTPFLVAWLNEHPFKGKPNAPLWLTTNSGNVSEIAYSEDGDGGARLTAHGLYTTIRRMGERADLDKRLHPHLFRHSRVTEAIKEGMSEAEARIHFGWSKKSDMPTHYAHVSGKDVDEAILRRAGKLRGGRDYKPALQTRWCQCGFENPATADFCTKPGCGKPLTIEAAQKRERQGHQLFLDALEEDQETMARLAERLMSKTTRRVREVKSKERR